jgi:hypothetical protein
MSEIIKILLTVVAGISIFIAGQIIQRWFIDPIQEQRKVIGEILYALTFYAYIRRDIFPQEKLEEAQKAIRNLASQLYKTLATIPCYKVFELLHLVPKRKAINRASVELTNWSNTLSFPENVMHASEVMTSLGMKHLIDLYDSMQDKDVQKTR